MNRIILALSALAGSLSVAVAVAQTVPGATVDERAVNGAKEYLKQKKVQNPKITILLNSLYQNALPAYNDRWEKLTGVKVETVPLGYTDIIVRHLTDEGDHSGHPRRHPLCSSSRTRTALRQVRAEVHGRIRFGHAR